MNKYMQRIAVIVGEFDPVHSGHLTLVREASKFGHVVVLLHSDACIQQYTGRVPTPWAQRAEWLREITKVIEVYPFDDRQNHARAGLEMLRKKFKHAEITLVTGNATVKKVEEHACQSLNIRVVTNAASAVQYQVVRKTKQLFAPAPITKVVCLKWGDKYGPEYVNQLAAAVRQNTTVPYEFHCFTDSADGISDSVRVHPLKYENLASWWNKLYLFSDEVPFSKNDRIFYIDLDTVITGNLDACMQVPLDKIVVLEDFYTGIAKSANAIGSGLMSWRHGDYTRLWTEFIADPETAVQQMHPYGDQYWIQQKVKDRNYWQHLLPNQVVSFKVHCRDGLPDGARVICFHGRPTIPESITSYTKDWKWSLEPAPWIADYWKADHV